MSLNLPPSVTVADVAGLLPALQTALEDGQMHIDAAALTDFDTSTLALLLHARRLAESRGAAFRVSGAPPKLVELAELYGVDSLLSLT